MGRQDSRSSTVARQMQDRTHKGGAVLWFLRKHAPMPVAYAGFMDDDEPVPSTTRTSLREESGTEGTAGGSANLKALVGPQRKFLHGALQVIGTELDKQPDSMADGFGRLPHPQGSRIDSQEAAFGVRENLRKRYAAHTDSELDELQAAVKAKEQEVVSLRKQVEQMERYLAATQAAAQRRVHRLMDEQDGGRNKQQSASIMQAVNKTQKKFLSSAQAQRWDIDDGVPRSKDRGDVIEEWQHEILRQSEKAQSMRAHVDEQAKLLQHQIVQRKAQESALFSSHTSTLRLRAQAQQLEARVQKLANELKRVYQTLPDIIQGKLDTSGLDSRKDHKEFELRALRVEHHSEFFKFMDPSKIKEEAESCQKRIFEIGEQSKMAREVLERGRWYAESGVQHAKATKFAMDALHDRYARFEAAGHPAGQLTIKDTFGNESHDADCVLQLATLSVNALTELIDILLEGEPLIEAAAIDTMMNKGERHREEQEDRRASIRAQENDMGRGSLLMMGNELSKLHERPGK